MNILSIYEIGLHIADYLTTTDINNAIEANLLSQCLLNDDEYFVSRTERYFNFPREYFHKDKIKGFHLCLALERCILSETALIDNIIEDSVDEMDKKDIIQYYLLLACKHDGVYLLEYFVSLGFNPFNDYLHYSKKSILGYRYVYAPFILACANGAINVVKYLTSLRDFTGHKLTNDGLWFAYSAEQYDIVDHLRVFIKWNIIAKSKVSKDKNLLNDVYHNKSCTKMLDI